MSVTISSGKKDINTLFKSMNLTPAVDSQKLAFQWLKKQENTFFGFVDGHYLNKEEVYNDGKLTGELHELKDSFSGEHLCYVYCLLDDFFSNEKYLDYLKNSEDGFVKWFSLAPSSRSKLLYSVAQMIGKHQDLFSAIEAISSGKQISRVKTKDVPQLIESFNYYAGCAMELEKLTQKYEDESDWFPLGPVCVVAEEFNNPSMALSLRVSSLLASGNSVLLLTDVKSCLSAFLLAEICYKSGIPEGVLNVMPLHQTKFIDQGQCAGNFTNFVFGLSLLLFRKLVFTGSLERSASYLRTFSKADVPYEILVPRRPVVIVYENCDFHSAVNGVLEAFLSHDTRSNCGGCKVLIQESICEKFLLILKKQFTKILIDQNMTKADKSGIVTEEQKEVLTKYVEEAEAIGGKVTRLPDVENRELAYSHMMPVLISNLPTNFKLVHEELGGPIIVTVPFRTVKESITMFNSDNKGSQVSIWTEKISVALEVASKLKTGCVCINSVNIIDSTTPFNGVYFSGNSVEGGKDAFFRHLSLTKFHEPKKLTPEDSSKSTFHVQDVREGVKEYKLFIGGSFKCSDNGLIKLDEVTFIPSGTEKDIQSAVSSAVSIQPRWEAYSESEKRKILLGIKDKLKLKEDEFVTELQKVLESTVEECKKEIQDTVDLLYFWATFNDRFTGTAKEIKKNMMVIQSRNPLGVIGIQCPDATNPLLSFVSLVIAAVSFGNAVVAIASSKYPTLALKMSEVFSSANVPGGVVNIICGNEAVLVPALCKNTDVNAIWFTDMPNSAVYSYSSYTQRVFNCRETWKDFNEAKKLKIALESTYGKTIFLPFGEIFAN